MERFIHDILSHWISSSLGMRTGSGLPKVGFRGEEREFSVSRGPAYSENAGICLMW